MVLAPKWFWCCTLLSYDWFAFFRRAGVFSREEVIEQAIDRWSAYIRLCGQAMTYLRDTMVETYIRETVDAKALSNLGENVGNTAGKMTTITSSEDMPADSGLSAVTGEYLLYCLR